MRHHSLYFISIPLLILLSLTQSGCGGGGSSSSGGFEGQYISNNDNFNVDISSVHIGTDRRPEVTFLATNDVDMMIPLSEFSDVRFILAVLERHKVGSPFAYRSYSTQIEMAEGMDDAVQAAYDTARQSDLVENPDGTYTYKFNTVLPLGYDRTATHQLGGQLRYVPTGEDTTYRANIAFTFRPDGLPVTEIREMVTTESCNKCHTRLSFHGNIRREVQLCILCHNPGTSDAETGNSLDFPELIHKIHRGADLPSFVIDEEPYQISGFRNSVHDYSTVHFPQDVRNCSVCHGDAPQGMQHETAPTLEACAACHDRTWFGEIDETPASFTNHIGGVQNDNSLCALCHSPEGNGVSLVSTAHILPTESDDAPGLELLVTEVSSFVGDTDTGVTITFSAMNGDGSPILTLDDMNILAATIAYPAPEYETYVRETIASAFGGPEGILVNNNDGTYDYTFASEIPSGSEETFAVAMEGRCNFEFRGGTHTQGTGSNGQLLFTLDESIPIDRRTVVDEVKCNVCHNEIRFHGELRTGVNYCVMCHNPNTTDEARRPAEEMPPVTVNFKDMIHRIHSGEDLNDEYTVYGFGNVAHDFTHVRFSGERQECTICHTEGTQTVPLPDEALSTIVTEDEALISEVLPNRAACTSCHDTPEANSHSLVQTAGDVESCAVCHSESDEYSVSNSHILEP